MASVVEALSLVPPSVLGEVHGTPVTRVSMTSTDPFASYAVPYASIAFPDSPYPFSVKRP